MLSRTLLATAVIVISIVVPSFNKVVGILGSFFSFSIAIIFPTAFHLKLNWMRLPAWERILTSTILLFGISAGTFSTVCVLIS